MKTAISVPDDVFEEADATAKRLNMSRSALYTAAIIDFVKTHKANKVRFLLDEVYADETSEVDFSLAQLQQKAAREQW